MNEFFLKIVNMSISASWLILAVLILRLLIKRAPKCITVLLWGIVAVRLICPVSIESVMSLVPSTETIRYEIMESSPPDINMEIPVVDHDRSPVTGEEYARIPDTSVSPTPTHSIISIIAAVWYAGIIIMLAYTAVSYLRLKNKISTAVLLHDNIFQSENVTSPFVLGIINPKIYLCFNMNERDIEYVTAHENAHICRKDYLWKMLGFLVLALHWFNPLVWLGYVIFCRDIELACDEKVIKNFDAKQKADYSQALLACSVNRRMIAVSPLAFGEVSVKERVKSVLNYKKPTFWIIIAAILASVVVAICFLTNPKTTTNDSDTQTFESTSDTPTDENTTTDESADVSTADTEEPAEKTVEDAKTVGEALEILFPEADLHIENISKLGVRYSDIKPSTYVEDKAEVSAILDTVKNAPLVSYEDGEGRPGWFASATFYGNDGKELFGFRASENAIYFNYGGDRLITEEGYFTELCELIELLEEATVPEETTENFEDPEAAKLDLNQDWLSIIGLTFEEMRERYGDVVEFKYLNGGPCYKFENTSGSYFFYGNKDFFYDDINNNAGWEYDSNGKRYPIPPADCVCLAMQGVLAKDIFTPSFEKLEIDEISNIDGLTILGSGKDETRGDSSYFTFTHNSFPGDDPVIKMEVIVYCEDIVLPESYCYINFAGALEEYNDNIVAEILRIKNEK